MCRLFGLISDHPVKIVFSMLSAQNAFRKQSYYNNDGWGIGHYDKGVALVYKEALPAYRSPEFERISKTIRSKIFIAHVRRRSAGIINLANTHPFKIGNWLLVQNDGIGPRWHDFIRKEVGKGKIMGRTSGEHILVWLHSRAGTIRGENQIQVVINTLEELLSSPQSITSANFILTTDDYLYAFRFAPPNTREYSLYYLERMKNDQAISNKTGFSVEMKNPSLLIDKRVFLVASERITSNENWRPFENGELLIVDKNVTLKKVTLM
jgi:predicted glutamine amidotransferase